MGFLDFIYAFIMLSCVITFAASMLSWKQGESNRLASLLMLWPQFIERSVIWLKNHFEWAFMLIALLCVGIMIDDPETGLFFIIIGFASVAPPFAVLPAMFMLVIPRLMTFGMTGMRVQIYACQIGWMLFLALVGLLVKDAGSAAEIGRIISNELSGEDWLLAALVFGLAYIVLPVGLFFWTRHARLHPYYTSWDRDMAKTKREILRGIAKESKEVD